LTSPIFGDPSPAHFYLCLLGLLGHAHDPLGAVFDQRALTNSRRAVGALLPAPRVARVRLATILSAGRWADRRSDRNIP